MDNGSTALINVNSENLGIAVNLEPTVNLCSPKFKFTSSPTKL